MLTLEQIKLNCRIDGNDDDDLLLGYLNAAKEVLAVQTSRNWYEDVVPDTDEDGLLYNHAAMQALQLLIAHWYANRESGTGLGYAIPQGFWWIIQPYRIYGV